MADEDAISLNGEPEQTSAIPMSGVLEAIHTPDSPLERKEAFQAGLYSGSASYSFPIVVSPATHNLAPNINLNYSSSANRGRAGIAGLGWDITLHAISRDMEGTPDNLVDDTFRLLLNGQSYDLVFMAADGRFHTQIESDLYVERIASGAPNSYGAYWLVRDKDGNSYRFGYSANAETVCDNRSYASSWYLDEVADTNNNHIYYSYLENPNSQDIGATYPYKIEYNNDRSRVVEFIYEGSDRPDRPMVYEQGCPVRYARRLAQIQVRAGSTVIRSYALAYNNGTNAVKSQLTSITELGSNGTPLPATTFTYENENRSWQESYEVWAPVDTPFLNDPNVELHDVNRDGLADIVDGDETWRVYLNTGSSWNASGVVWLNQSNHELSEPDTVVADVNGDGLADIVEGEGTTWKVNINNGNGWNGPSNWSAGSDHNLEELDTRLADANGDGLLDIVEGDGTTWTVNVNYGSGWNSPIGWPAGSDHNLEEADTTLVDVNGDGLPDIVEGDITWTVNLNNGSGWNPPQTWLVQANHKLDEPDTELMDANEDGFLDIVEGDGASGWDVNLNNGYGWDSPVSWTENGPDLNEDVALADANGDSFADIVTRQGGQGWLVYRNRGNQSNLLITIRNSLGGTISLSYQSSTPLDNTGPDSLSDLGFNVWVVKSVTRDNGVTGAHHVTETINYSYKDGLHDYPDKEFRGFAEVMETDSRGTTTTHLFHQGDDLKGKEFRTTIKDNGGNLFYQTEQTFSTAAQGTGYIVRLTRTDVQTYDGVGSNPKSTFTEYQYDQYGNVTRTFFGGDAGLSGDERYQYSEYAYNTPLWIVNRPKHTYLRDSDDTTKVRESWFYYDEHSNLDDPPTRGNLTKQIDWLDAGNDVVTRYQYDNYGNRIRAIDGNSHITRYIYGISDLTHTFVEKEINAKLQETLYTYHVGTGNLLSQTDPNGYLTRYEYDVYGRLIKEIKPYDNSTNPTLQHDYFLDGSAPEGVLIAQRTISGQAITLPTYTWLDGFGRVIQTREPAEDANQQIVVNTFYDNRGKPEIQSIPHLDAFATGYAAPLSGVHTIQTTYDPIGREIQLRNPDNTNQTITYDHWRIDYLDENGHRISQFLDAYENIIRVDEYNGAEIYTTLYVYTPADELKRITDHLGNIISWVYDSLGRQTRLTDPDRGVWLYSYDAVGTLISETDGRGVTTFASYDELNRIVLKDYPTLADTIYIYDQETIGTLSTVQDAAGTLHYFYDQRLRQIQEDRTMGGITWTTRMTYDAADRITSLTYPSGEVVNHTYNNQGQVEAVGNLVTDYDYDALQRIIHKQFSNGVATDLTYAPDHLRLATIQTSGLQNLAYEYDAVGNLARIHNNLLGTEETFTYDDLDRLLTAQEPDGYSHSYTYNPIGNILTVTTDVLETGYTYGENAGSHAVTTLVKNWLVPLIAGPLSYNANPVTGQPVTAAIDITNVSDNPIALERILVGVHGPYCSGWDCPNISDFPNVENLTLQPGETYHYEQERAFNIVDSGYFIQALTVEAGGIWRHHSPVESFAVSSGITVVSPLVLTPSTPIVGQVVTATYTVRNVSNQTITLPWLGVIARGPNCTDWNCDGWADFPTVQNVTLQPNEEYVYVGQRAFNEAGTGYLADAAFADHNPWWYTVPNGQRLFYEVSIGLQVLEPLSLTPPNPPVGQLVTAQYKLQNVSNQVLQFQRIGVGVHGPYCSDWNCPNVSDFPWEENITLEPGDIFEYIGERAFYIPDDGYLVQPLTHDSADVWRSHGPIEPLTISSGIEIVEDLSLSPATPIIGQLVTASYTIHNTSDQTITLPQLGVIARGPNCTDWNCDGWADFPPLTNITLEPDEEYTYVGHREFNEAGSGYLADAVFADHNPWWYTIPNGERLFFEVSIGLQVLEPLTFTPPNPLVGHPVTAHYRLQNVSDQTLHFQRIGVGVHGPYCSDWNCPNVSDFPWAEGVTLQPGEEFEYNGERAFYIPDDGYLVQPLSHDAANVWRSHGPIEQFPISSGIEIVQDLVLSPATTVVGQMATATYTIRNVGNVTITLPWLGVIARGPNCTNWNCAGWADFPPIQNVTVPPGDEFTYIGQRVFYEAGTGYLADAVFADHNPWWYTIPNGTRLYFSVITPGSTGFLTYLPLVIRE